VARSPIARFPNTYDDAAFQESAVDRLNRIFKEGGLLPIRELALAHLNSAFTVLG
jgi:hypothetical protein